MTTVAYISAAANLGPSADGGASFVDARLVAQLRDSGYRVKRVSLSELPQLRAQIRNSYGKLISTYARMVVRRESYNLAKWKSQRNFRRAVLGLRSAVGDADAIVASGWLATILADTAALPVDLVVAHNCEWLISQQFAPLPLRLLRDAKRSLSRELSLYAAVGTVVTLSVLDEWRLSELGLQGVETVRLLDLRATPVAPSTASHRLGLLGSFSWPPNVRDYEMLAEVILPRLREVEPSAQLIVAGRGSDQLKTRAGVQIMGQVSTVSDFYDRVDTVVLLRASSQTGVPVKVIEALEMGKRVIASEAVARALGYPRSLETCRTAEDLVVLLTRGRASATGRRPIDLRPLPEVLEDCRPN